MMLTSSSRSGQHSPELGEEPKKREPFRAPFGLSRDANYLASAKAASIAVTRVETAFFVVSFAEANDSAETAETATTIAMMMDFMTVLSKNREVHSLRDWARRGFGAYGTGGLLRSVDTEHLRGSTQLQFVAEAKKTKKSSLEDCFRFLACCGFYTLSLNLVRRNALQASSKSLSVLRCTPL